MKGFDQDSILFFNSLKERNVSAGERFCMTLRNILWFNCRAMCHLAKYAVGALAAHFCYYQQYKDLHLDFEKDLVFNPYLFQIFEAGKGPGDLKSIEVYLSDRELERQRRFREELAIRSEWADFQENPIANAGYFFYPTSEEPGHFEKFLADDLAYFFHRIRDMHRTWVKAGEDYISLWKAFPQIQAADSVISGPGTLASSSNDVAGQGAIQNSLAENTENTATESSTESDDMPSTFKTIFTGVDSFFV
jgi:hypothetical protein